MVLPALNLSILDEGIFGNVASSNIDAVLKNEGVAHSQQFSVSHSLFGTNN